MNDGAKALAERLHETAVRNHNLGEGPLRAICDHPESHEPRADAILLNGAVFLSAEEVERLRRIEATLDQLDNEAHQPVEAPGEALWMEGVEHAVKTLRAALTEPSHD